MAGPGAHGGQRGPAEAGARVGHVHACRGGGGWIQVDVAVDVHGAGRGIHLEGRGTQHLVIHMKINIKL